jgi:catechol 2,3-dioxygenase-like lactoylglutathione lyase family enzyme
VSLGHLLLRVRDQAAAERFYVSWFGMKVQRRDSDITIVTDEQQIVLALMRDFARASMPHRIRFGFRMRSPAEVFTLNERMVQSGIAIRKPLCQDESLVSFRCADPDGYVIEVYWEAESVPS